MATKVLNLAGVVLAVSIGGTALAQETELTELAEDYVMLPANQAMMDQMLSAETMAAQFAAGLPPNVELPAETLDRVGTLMADAMAPLRPRMEALMIDGAAETFTQGELQALIDFYSTPEGEDILLKMQAYFTLTMSELTPEIMAAMTARQDELTAIIEEGRQ